MNCPDCKGEMKKTFAQDINGRFITYKCKDCNKFYTRTGMRKIIKNIKELKEMVIFT